MRTYSTCPIFSFPCCKVFVLFLFSLWFYLLLHKLIYFPKVSSFLICFKNASKTEYQFIRHVLQLNTKLPYPSKIFDHTYITHGKLFYRLCEWIFPLRSFIYDSMKDDDIRIPPEFRNEQILEYKGKVTYDANHNHQNRFVGTGGHQFF